LQGQQVQQVLLAHKVKQVPLVFLEKWA